MSKNYKLIWFQHLRKAAGTTIIQHALANQEVLYPTHTNGIPRYGDGRMIRFWEMEEAELRRFIDHCEKEGITFIATEFAAPDFTLLASDPRVTLLTCLRDPLDRFISNFYYAYYFGYTDCKSFKRFVNSGEANTMFNYYCRIFSRHNDRLEPVGLKEFELANMILSLFHCKVVLKDRGSFEFLKKLLGWNINRTVQANPTTISIRQAASFIVRGKAGLLWRPITHPRKMPDERFKNYFKEANQWDYRLLQAASISR